MPKTWLPAAAVALAALAPALPAIAQDDTTTEPAADTAAETPAESDDAATPEADTAADGETEGNAETGTEPSTDPDVFDLGTPADASGDSSTPGSAYVREEFQDWQMRCLVAEEGPDPCQLYQLLMNEDETPVAEFTLVPLPPGTEAVAGAVVIVPLETQLTERLTISIDGGQARRYEYDFCNLGGCVARFGLTADQIASFKAGNAATVSIVPAAAPDQRVDLNLSLSGFTAAFDYTENPPEE
ncbi:invasion associated locus B family protein [Pseudoroseicyclus sp. CXY001]|uniref:invasion associated locus B family protein n=1 Tax=Pseudoroseicyclus sp. CXY001 TaxID=3242492 RepID=UPI003570E6C9